VTSRRTRRIGLAASAVVVAATAAAVPATSGRAASPRPTIRLMTAIHHVTAERFDDGGGGDDIYIPEAVYAATVNGAFEVDASRQQGHVVLEQVRRSGSTVTNLGRIKPGSKTSLMDGFPKFFSVYITDASGNVVASAHPSFCPTGGYDSQRVSPNGPPNPTYPYYCGGNLTRATVWGIDEGWAAPVYFDLKVSPDAMPDGTYTMTVAIAPPYVKGLGVPSNGRQVAVQLKVVTDNGCRKICPGGGATRSHVRNAHAPRSHLGRPAGAGYPSQPTSGGLPDLVALPAHGLRVSHSTHSGKDYLGFGATIYNSGPGTFDVEGFRHNGHPTMQARQYLYRNGQQQRSFKIGTFEFDTRKGHHHWHLEDVARYDLLDASQQRVVRSDKQSFCLAPTDAINLTRPGALWNPDTVGLGSSCPSEQSLWLRETLPVGWGDTYVQSKGGQAFDITNLPNGRYIIRIATNPRHRIHELYRANDTSLLAIDLGGTPGARTATVVGQVTSQ
jgi:hypothetical protein